jgi:hypothetical protein
MATDDLNAAQWALLAVTEGWSATAGLDRYRAEGGHMANQTWYRLFGEIKSSIDNRASTYNEPVNLRPVAGEIRVWETKRATGYIQQVEVLVKPRGENEVISVPFAVSGRTLVSRANALKQALDVYTSDNAKKYNQQVLGAIYTGTYQAIPKGV